MLLHTPLFLFLWKRLLAAPIRPFQLGYASHTPSYALKSHARQTDHVQYATEAHAKADEEMAQHGEQKLNDLHDIDERYAKTDA